MIDKSMKKGAGQGKVALRQRLVGVARQGSPAEASVKSRRPRRSSAGERLRTSVCARCLSLVADSQPPRRPRSHPVVDMCHCAQISAALIHLLGCLAAGSSATPQIIRRHLAFFHCRRRTAALLIAPRAPTRRHHRHHHHPEVRHSLGLRLLHPRRHVDGQLSARRAKSPPYRNPPYTQLPPAPPSPWD